MRAPEEAPDASSRVVEAPEISALLDAILESGYRLLGPTVKDGAIVYDEIASASALPAGVGQEQTNGRYRLRTRVDDALFGYAVGPHAWKKFLFPASLRLFSATRRKKTLQLRPEEGDPRPDAFLGVRPCDVAAIARQDRVFLARAVLPTPRIAPAASRRSSSPSSAARPRARASAPRSEPARARPRASTSPSRSSSTGRGTISSSRPAPIGAPRSSRRSRLAARTPPTSRPRARRPAAPRRAWAGRSTFRG